MDTASKKYPDTKEGCKQFLTEQTTLKLTPQSTFEIDHSVEGVWCIHNVEEQFDSHLPEKGDIVIYLAGYKDPFGRVREYNDFEFCAKATQRPL